VSLQVRAEVQNLFNRLLLPNPSSAGRNFSANPTTNALGN
jgi:hypothetical protein